LKTSIGYCEKIKYKGAYFQYKHILNF